jgi:hypothetical protein
MIHIENKKTYRGKGIYVGRMMPGLPGSILGNPFRIGRDGTRDQVIAKYRRWLWEQIKLKNEAYVELRRIAELARRGDITLVCWCAPEFFQLNPPIGTRVSVNPPFVCMPSERSEGVSERSGET